MALMDRKEAEAAATATKVPQKAPVKLTTDPKVKADLMARLFGVQYPMAQDPSQQPPSRPRRHLTTGKPLKTPVRSSMVGAHSVATW